VADALLQRPKAAILRLPEEALPERMGSNPSKGKPCGGSAQFCRSRLILEQPGPEDCRGRTIPEAGTAPASFRSVQRI
jgi:hypothetical protein